MQASRPIDHPTLLILATGLMLGGGYVIARWLTASVGLHPAWMVVAQSLIAGGGLAAPGWRRGALPLDRPTLRFYLLAGLTAVTVPNLAGLFALRGLSVGLYSLLVTLTPLATWAFASLVARRMESATRLIGVLVSLAGVTVALLPRSGDAEFAAGALLLGLAVPLVLAAGNVYRAARLPRHLSASTLAAGTLLSQVPVALAFALAVGAPMPSPMQTLGLCGFGVWTLLAYLPYFRLQAVADAVRFSQIGYVIALTGIAGGTLVLGEHLPISLAAAAPLVFLGIAITNGHLRSDQRTNEGRLVSQDGSGVES